MYALRNIVIINGRPSLSAALMLALIYRDHGGDAVHVVETTATVCTLEYKRKDRATYERLSFTIEDARRAELLNKENWRKYPAAMLRARAISAVAGLAFPDSLAGMYTAEEVNPDAEVSEAGEIVDVAALAPAEPADAADAPIDEDELRALNGGLARLRVTGAERGLLVEAASAGRVRHVQDLTSGEAARLWAAIETRRAARPAPGGNGATGTPEVIAAELI